MGNFCTKCGAQLQNGTPCPNCNKPANQNVAQNNLNTNTQSNINQEANQNTNYNQTQINQNNINTNQNVNQNINNNQNQKPKKKKRGCLISIIIFLVVIVGLIILVYNLAKPKEYKEVATIAKDYQYLAISKDDEYIISNAEEDIYFHVTSDSKYKVIDEEGNEVQTELQGNKVVNPSKYKKGKKYTITLSEGSFLSSQLENTKKVTFKIKREEAKKYKYTSNVKKTTTNDIKISNDNKSIESTKKYKVGDVIVVGNNDSLTSAYYITAVNGNNYQVRDAEINEIFSELDYYFEAPADLSDYKVSKQIEEYVANSVKKSAWYNYLVEEVHAAPPIEIVIKNLENGIEAEVTVTLAAGQSNILMNSVNHEVKIVFTQSLAVNNVIDITLTNWDVSLDITSGQSFEINVENKFLEFSNAETEKATEELMNKLKEALEKKQYMDTSDKSAELAEILIPTGVPCLNIVFELELVHEINASIDFGISTGQTTNVVVGFDFGVNEEFKFIGSYEKEYTGVDITFSGKLEQKLGIEISVGIDVLSIASVKADLAAGVYAELETKINLSSNKEHFFESTLKVENGIYIEFGVSAEVFELEYKHTFVEKQFPILTKEWTTSKDFNEVTPGILEGEDESNTSNGGYTIQSEEERLQKYSCVDSTEDDSYVKYTYNFENGKFKNIEMKGVYYINTGIDVLDQFLELIIQIIAVCLKVYYNFGTIYYIEGNYHYIIVPLDEKDIQKELGDINIDDYYSFKESMTNNEYICK